MDVDLSPASCPRLCLLQLSGRFALICPDFYRCQLPVFPMVVAHSDFGKMPRLPLLVSDAMNVVEFVDITTMLHRM
jgi:hypothetical protein